MQVLAVRFEIKPDQISAFAARVEQQARDSLALEPGCRRFDVSRSAAAPNVFFLYELYDDEAAITAHRETAHYEDFRNSVDPMCIDRRVETYVLQNAAE